VAIFIEMNIISEMNRIKDIQNRIQKLTGDELDELREWLQTFSKDSAGIDGCVEIANREKGEKGRKGEKGVKGEKARNREIQLAGEVELETNSPKSEPSSKDLKHVALYTDGACLGNPGPGGYAAILDFNGHRKEISGGFKWTTNNRMELMAAIAGLEAIKEPCRVTLYTDSQYVQKAMDLGWAKQWRAKGWRTSSKQPAKNIDLWKRLLAICEKHEVKFKWVRGHAGHPENERCDEISTEIAARENLPEEKIVDVKDADDFL